MPTTYYRRKRRSRVRPVLLVLGTLVVVFVLIQLVPYGRNHTNPPVTAPFHWSSVQAKTIAQRSCYDCHSNKTKYWWAVEIAPFSWLAQHDIADGRARVNFSEWNGALTEQGLKFALGHGMPPLQFTLLHPGAKLSAAGRRQLLAGFQQSLADRRNGGSGAAGSASAGGSGSSGGSSPGSSSSASSSAAGSGSSSGSASGSGSSSSGPDPTAVIAARCGSCHSSAPAQQFRASSAAEAKALIDNMVQQGASISPTEEKALIKYYTR